MDLADVTSLVQEVLERVSETERELRRLRREGSLPETRVRCCKVLIHRVLMRNERWIDLYRYMGCTLGRRAW